MEYEFIRGDSFEFGFRLRDKEKNMIFLTDGDRMYITFKTSPNDKKVLFQKTLGNGIEKVEDYYLVNINPEDTEKLAYNTYGFDIEIITSTGKKKTVAIGSITLTDEYTHKGDE